MSGGAEASGGAAAAEAAVAAWVRAPERGLHFFVAAAVRAFVAELRSK